MEMPKPNEHHKKLAVLAGSWRGEELMHPSSWDPKGGNAIGIYHARMTLDGFALISDGTQERDGVVTYKGLGVFGWHAHECRYLMHWSDNVSGVPSQLARGQWEGAVLRFQDRGHMGHVRYTYTFEDDGSYRFSLHNSRDGKNWSSLVDGHYHKTS